MRKEKEIKSLKVTVATRKRLEEVRNQISKELGVSITLGEAVKILAERTLKKEAER